MKKISYGGYRFPPAIIQQAIWLYLRFTLSLRDVEDLSALDQPFGPLIAVNEVYLKIDGRMAYLWRAVDAEGEVLDVLVQSKRDQHAALKLMRKLLKIWFRS
jgi:putative transposase